MWVGCCISVRLQKWVRPPRPPHPTGGGCVNIFNSIVEKGFYIKQERVALQERKETIFGNQQVSDNKYHTETIR